MQSGNSGENFLGCPFLADKRNNECNKNRNYSDHSKGEHEKKR